MTAPRDAQASSHSGQRLSRSVASRTAWSSDAEASANCASRSTVSSRSSTPHSARMALASPWARASVSGGSGLRSGGHFTYFSTMAGRSGYWLRPPASSAPPVDSSPSRLKPSSTAPRDERIETVPGSDVLPSPPLGLLAIDRAVPLSFRSLRVARAGLSWQDFTRPQEP